MKNSALEFFEKVILYNPKFKNEEELITKFLIGMTPDEDIERMEEGIKIMLDSFTGDISLGYYWKDKNFYSPPTATQFREHFIDFVQDSRNIVLIKLLDEISADKKNEEINAKSLFQHLTFLINEYNIKYSKNEFSEILNTLEDIQSKIANKYELVSKISKKANLPNNSAAPVKKIKWFGQDNVLYTLFYELAKGGFNGKKYIDDSNMSELATLIKSSFCKENGDEFEYSSILTSFNNGKPDKRAKDPKRIKENEAIRKAEKEK